MPKIILDWALAAEDANTYLGDGKRAFPPHKMRAFVDDLVMLRTATQSELQIKYGSENFIATTLANVTTAVHGGGAVPKVGGWYSVAGNPLTYTVSNEFASAWKSKRRLDR